MEIFNYKKTPIHRGLSKKEKRSIKSLAKEDKKNKTKKAENKKPEIKSVEPIIEEQRIIEQPQQPNLTIEIAEELPSVAEKNAEISFDVPADELSRKIYLLLSEGDADDELFTTVVNLLDKRILLVRRLNTLINRIAIIVTDAKKLEWEFEELKFKTHLENIYSLPEIDDSENTRENLDSIESLPEKREALKRTVSLITNLERSRTSVAKLCKENTQSILALLPSLEDDTILKEIEGVFFQEAKYWREIQNHATSDGELPQESFDAPSEINDFISELQSSIDEPLTRHNGDSLFHLD